MAFPHWPTGIGHPLGCAGVDMPPCVVGSACRVSEQPVKICTPQSNNIQLETDDRMTIYVYTYKRHFIPTIVCGCVFCMVRLYLMSYQYISISYDYS